MLYMTLSYFQQYSLGLLKEIIYLEEMQSIIYLTISHSLAFLNWAHFFLNFNRIFLFWYNQACISLFRKKDDALNQSFIFHTFLLLIHSFLM